MKNFLIFVLIVGGLYLWAQDWVTSGKMDNFILQHENSDTTPKLLYGLAELSYLVQQPKAASFYYRWLIKDFPKSPHVAQAHWELGQCYEDLNQRADALEQYTILMSSFSESEYGRMANGRYGQLRY